jgi:hypothetical protein
MATRLGSTVRHGCIHAGILNIISGGLGNREADEVGWNFFAKKVYGWREKRQVQIVQPRQRSGVSSLPPFSLSMSLTLC